MPTFSELLQDTNWYDDVDAQENNDAHRKKIINGVICLVRALYPIYILPSASLKQLQLIEILKTIKRNFLEAGVANQDIADSLDAITFILEVFEMGLWNSNTENSDLFFSIYSALYGIASQEFQYPSEALVERVSEIVERTLYEISSQDLQVPPEAVSANFGDIQSEELIIAVVSECGVAGCSIM